MFNIRVSLLIIYFNFYADGNNVFGTIESLINNNNSSVQKFIAFNTEDRNRVCLILQLHSKVVINYKNFNMSREIKIGNNTSFTGNCTGIYRELTIDVGVMRVHLIWEREPDPYEHGEIGWSSVGAPANTTSGTYALTKINVSLPMSILTNVSRQDSTVNLLSIDHERFKTRSGDHYVCDSKIIFDLHHLNSSLLPDSGQVQVTFEMDNSKMQAYSDVNVSDFTGTGQMCHQDLPSDSGVSIGIGVAVAVLIFAVLAFLAIGRLKEKDQQYQELDAGKWATVRS